MQDVAMMKLRSVRLPQTLRNTIEDLLKDIPRKDLRTYGAHLREHLKGNTPRRLGTNVKAGELLKNIESFAGKQPFFL
jgi:hypothetical protein